MHFKTLSYNHFKSSVFEMKQIFNTESLKILTFKTQIKLNIQDPALLRGGPRSFAQKRNP